MGEYSFSNWKVAICSLYKRLHFESVGPVQGRPVVFDDTVYFVPCRNKREARAICDLLSSEESVKFLSAHIFWDSKRPITTSVLNRVNIESLAEMLGRSDEIRGRHDSLPTAQDGLPSFLKPPTHSAQLAVKKET